MKTLKYIKHGFTLAEISVTIFLLSILLITGYSEINNHFEDIKYNNEQNILIAETASKLKDNPSKDCGNYINYLDIQNKYTKLELCKELIRYEKTDNKDSFFYRKDNPKYYDYLSIVRYTEGVCIYKRSDRPNMLGEIMLEDNLKRTERLCYKSGAFGRAKEIIKNQNKILEKLK